MVRNTIENKITKKKWNYQKKANKGECQIWRRKTIECFCERTSSIFLSLCLFLLFHFIESFDGIRIVAEANDRVTANICGHR